MPKPFMTLPSSVRYESYVARKKAFQILDEKLKWSIRAFESEVLLIDRTGNFPDEYYVFEVVDAAELTGKELRAFNVKLDEIFEKEDSDYKAIILTDNQYAFEVRAVIKGGTVQTNDYSELSKDSATAKYNELVAERNRLLKSSDENDPIIINLDQQLRGLEHQMQTDSNMTDQTLSTLDEKYDQLVLERERLLKNTNENDPRIVNLDQQLQGLKRQIQLEQDVIIPFAIVEEPPIFPGCENETDPRACFKAKLQRHISKNFKYPEEPQRLGIQGRVNIMFTIDQKGFITNIRKRGPNKLLVAEADRIINLLPKMIPGKQKGQTVKVPFSIPITFKFNLNEKEILISMRDLLLGDINNDIIPTNFIKHEVLNNLAVNYNELVGERERLLEHSSQENPIIINLNKKIGSIKNEILETILKEIE